MGDLVIEQAVNAERLVRVIWFTWSVGAATEVTLGQAAVILSEAQNLSRSFEVRNPITKTARPLDGRVVEMLRTLETSD